MQLQVKLEHLYEFLLHSTTFKCLRFTFRRKLNLPIPLNVTSEINSVNLFI